jgi:protein AbiQ
MKNSKDFHKIKEGIYGAINFNYMIPADESDLIELDIDNEPDDDYRNLLLNQYFEITKIETVICDKANNLRALVCKSNGELSRSDIRVKQRCCDFILLEQKMKEYVHL